MNNYEGAPNLSDKEYQLECLRINLSSLVYKGYPAFEDRFNTLKYNLERDSEGRLILPDGPWVVNNHSNRTDSETIPTKEESNYLSAQGHELDSNGRPIHPWFYDMINDPALGVVVGKGAYWEWGPNYTADPIVISEGKVLLIQRADTGVWALPGGFIDKTDTGMEDAVTAASRETSEEAKIVIPSNVVPKIVYKGTVADIRTTANSWAETTAILFELDNIIEPKGKLDEKEVQNVGWFPIETVTESHLFGSHRLLLQKAIEQIN